VAIFVIVFFSGLILPLPANTLLLVAGAFASQGYMNISIIFMVAVISNVLGDCFGYMLTRFWGQKIITKPRFKRFLATPKVESSINQYTNLTIFITRFLGTLGIVVNFLAGLIAVPFQQFLLYDAIGNALTIACFVFTGYGLGVYVNNYSIITKLLGWIIVIAVLIFLLVRVIVKKHRRAKKK
jgi:membrane protein DedA with SNARE-associated domain